MSNFIDGLIALTRNIRLIFFTSINNGRLLGFLAGAFLTITIAIFVLTENPSHLPIILRYSSTDSFQKIAPKAEDGSYTIGFTGFLKLYTQVRTLSLVAFIAFCIMVTTIVLTKTA